jgi:hypothetical protein
VPRGSGFNLSRLQSAELPGAKTLGHDRIWLVGLGNSTEQRVGQDLEANGYRLADIVTSENSEAVLYVAS